MTIKASEVAYLITLVESDKALPELAEKLRAIYRMTQGRKYGPIARIPVAPELIAIYVEAT